MVSHQSLCSVCQDPNSFTEFKGFVVGEEPRGGAFGLDMFMFRVTPTSTKPFLRIPPLTAECKHSKSRFQGIIRKTTQI